MLSLLRGVSRLEPRQGSWAYVEAETLLAGSGGFGGHGASSITERERDKPMSYPTTIGRGQGGPVAAISLTLLLLAGCTSVSVDREVGAMEQLPP